MIKRNQRKSGIILSYFNIIISNLVNFFYTPLLLRMLGDSEYGVYGFCAAIVEYLAVFNLGYASVYVIYYSKFKAAGDEKSIESLNGMMMSIYTVLGVVVMAAGMILTINAGWVMGDKFTAEEIAVSKLLLGVLTLNLAVTMPSSVFSSIIATKERFVFQRIVELLRNVMGPLFSIAVLLLGFRSFGVAVITLIVTILSFGLNVYYCFYRLKIRFDFSDFDRNLFSNVMKFSFFLLIQSLVDCLNWQVDKFLLGRICGAVAVTYYTLGSKINAMFMTLSTAIYPVFIPKAHAIMAKDNSMKEVSDLFIKVGRMQFMIVLFAFTSFVFFGREFLTFWVGNGYKESYYVAVLLMAPMVIQLSESLGVEIVKALNKHKFLNLLYLFICIINVLVSIPLTQRFGSVGAAFGSSVTIFAGWGVIANLYYGKVAKIDIRRFFVQILGLLKAAAVPAAFGIWIFLGNRIAEMRTFIPFAILYALIFWIFLWRFGMNAEEKGIIRTLILKR